MIAFLASSRERGVPKHQLCIYLICVSLFLGGYYILLLLFYCYYYYFEKQDSQVKSQVWALAVLRRLLNLSIPPTVWNIHYEDSSITFLEPHRGWKMTDEALKLWWTEEGLRTEVLGSLGGNPHLCILLFYFPRGREKLVEKEKEGRSFWWRPLKQGLRP